MQRDEVIICMYTRVHFILTHQWLETNSSSVVQVRVTGTLHVFAFYCTFYASIPLPDRENIALFISSLCIWHNKRIQYNTYAEDLSALVICYVTAASSCHPSSCFCFRGDCSQLNWKIKCWQCMFLQTTDMFLVGFGLWSQQSWLEMFVLPIKNMYFLSPQVDIVPRSSPEYPVASHKS